VKCPQPAVPRLVRCTVALSTKHDHRRSASAAGIGGCGGSDRCDYSRAGGRRRARGAGQRPLPRPPTAAETVGVSSARQFRCVHVLLRLLIASLG